MTLMINRKQNKPEATEMWHLVKNVIYILDGQKKKNKLKKLTYIIPSKFLYLALIQITLSSKTQVQRDWTL